MYEILIESLDSKAEFERIKEMLRGMDAKAIGACLEDHLLMIDSSQSVSKICGCLQSSGIKISGLAIREDENVESISKFHGKSFIKDHQQ